MVLTKLRNTIYHKKKKKNTASCHFQAGFLHHQGITSEISKDLCKWVIGISFSLLTTSYAVQHIINHQLHPYTGLNLIINKVNLTHIRAWWWRIHQAQRRLPGSNHIIDKPFLFSIRNRCSIKQFLSEPVFQLDGVISLSSVYVQKMLFFNKSIAINAIGSLCDFCGSSNDDSQAIKQQWIFTAWCGCRANALRNSDVVIHLYCRGGLPSASHVTVACWSGELIGKMRSLGSVLHLGPWNMKSSVQAGERGNKGRKRIHLNKKRQMLSGKAFSQWIYATKCLLIHWTIPLNVLCVIFDYLGK